MQLVSFLAVSHSDIFNSGQVSFSVLFLYDRRPVVQNSLQRVHFEYKFRKDSRDLLSGAQVYGYLTVEC